MGKYHIYPDYSETNTDWISSIPSHWNLIPIGRLFRRIKITNHADKELLSVYRDYGVVPKASRDDNFNKPSEDLSPYQLVEPDDLVMNKMKAWQGSIAISEYEGIVSPAYFTYKPSHKLYEVAYPKYIHYLLRNPLYIAQYLRNSKGIRVNQWDLDPDEFQKIELLLPTKSEQLKIFQFLDHETAKIDTLIDKQQQLIQLLKEKRQAVISHAVTKGLNPNAPMRDSGVEWLGEVPEHWNVTQLKYICKLIDGDRGSAYPNEADLVDEGIPFVSSKNIVDFKLTKKNLNYITKEKYEALGRGKLVEDDLVITVRGTIGHVGVFDPKIIGCSTGFINAQMMIMRPEKGLTDYLQFVSESLFWTRQLDIAAYGSTVRQLSNEILRNIIVAVPPAEELQELIRILRISNDRFENLIGKASTAIMLMHERRTALISAAVTGKIDVRDWQVPALMQKKEAV